MSWIVKKVGRTELIHGLGKRDRRSIGVNVSTKAVGSNKLHLITSEYKHPEDTGTKISRFHLKIIYFSRNL